MFSFRLPARPTFFFRKIVAAELSLFRRHPTLIAAVLAIALVPALYALIYLTSVWDPNAKTSTLPVAIVNLDLGTRYRGRELNVGADLAQELIRLGTFGFRSVADEAQARQDVNLGRLAFAVIIPVDFSANAVPGARAGAGRVRVIISEGNNYASAGFGRRFAEELGHRVNETLNERRWGQVLSSVDGSGKRLEQLRHGMADLQTGSEALRDGAVKYTSGASHLGSGLRQLGAGLRSMETRLPPESDLNALKAGVQKLSTGQRELGGALEQLQTGAGTLAESASQMQEQAVQIPRVGEQVAKAAGDFAAGGNKLKDGLGAAIDGNARLIRGTGKLEASTSRLIDGAGAMGESLHAMTARLPEDARLEELLSGGRALVEGANRLRIGIEQVNAVLPKSVGAFDGSARGLADSVEPELEVLAPVANNGNAFIPNMVAMALWLGAVMATYLFSLRRLPSEYAGAYSITKCLAKFVLPATLVLLQALFAYLMLVQGLGVQTPADGSFALTMVSASLSFLAMVFVLLRVFGEAGKLIAVLLLTVQLAAGGGVMPIELTADVFQRVHDWLPFTWVVIAFRACLFGAFDNGWLHAWTTVVQSGVAALVLASVWGRWRYVPLKDYKPAVDL